MLSYLLNPTQTPRENSTLATGDSCSLSYSVVYFLSTYCHVIVLDRLSVMESMDITTPTWIVKHTNIPSSLAATRFQMLEQIMRINASCAGMYYTVLKIKRKMKELIAIG